MTVAVLVKHIDRIDLSTKNYSLVKDFKMPDYSPHEYPCQKCGTMLRLKQARVLYCRYCKIGILHPRYNFEKDVIV